MSLEIVRRLRRNRIHPAIRELVQETRLHPSDFVMPFFVKEGRDLREAIDALPGQYRFSPDVLLKEAHACLERGIKALALFPANEKGVKDARGSEALNRNNLINRTVKELKSRFPELAVIVDIALDPYTDHGHDGLVNDKGDVLNDETVEVLQEMALYAAEAGVDIVAPSDMMDGRVLAIREALDQGSFQHVGILAYAAKYASNLYGPFRSAAQVKLQFGDKKAYQLNPANVREALLECRLDEEEGADILMVKPALSYLDIIAKLRASSDLPIAAYHVSGEYSMVMAAHEKGWLNGPKTMEEHLLSIKRAGADIIFTYAAKDVAETL
jgi:porphobilinogen synthase